MPEPKPDIVPGAQGRVKDPAKDKRLAANRPGPTGQGKCTREDDKRTAANRDGSAGQGRVKRSDDGRLSENRRKANQ